MKKRNTNKASNMKKISLRVESIDRKQVHDKDQKTTDTINSLQNQKTTVSNKIITTKEKLEVSKAKKDYSGL